MVGSLYDSLSFIFPPQTGDISKFGLLKSCSKCPFPALNSHPHPHVLFWTKGTSFHDFPHVSPLFVEFSAFVGGFSMGFPMVFHGFPWFSHGFPMFSPSEAWRSPSSSLTSRRAPSTAPKAWKRRRRSSTRRRSCPVRWGRCWCLGDGGMGGWGMGDGI